VGAARDLAVVHHDGTHWHLAGPEPAPRLLKRRAHQRFVG
jgi:hypothetical protein